MLNIVQHFDVLTEGLKAGVNGLMNIVNQSAADSNSSGVFFVNFNQDCSSLAVGTHSGYKLFSLTSVEFLDQIIENGNEDTCLVERLFSSSLVAIVSLAAPRKLKVCHFKKRTEICNYSYSNSILAVKLNRARLVVCLEESLYIHNIRDMKVLHTIRDTPPNPTGLCSLSINSENCFLAYPGSSTIGEVQIFDAVNLHSKIMIPAHDSPLAALAFSPTGLRIATASEKGTVIRVFSVTDGAKLYEFRRGVKRCVSISSLSFSMCSQFLCCSSNTETVHVFKLEEPKETPRQSLEEGGWMGYLTKAVTASANYLPSQVTDVFNQGRAFATAHLPVHGVRNVTAITTIQNQLRLLVAAADGYLYIYNLDSNEGGDLTLTKQHRLDGRIEDSTTKAPTDTTASPSTTRSEPKPVKNPDAGSPISSYAGVVKGNPIGQMSGTDSEKFREMAAAAESPPKGGFKFDDDQEFPPVTHKPRQSLEEGGWMGYLTKAVTASANYLPSQVTDVFNQGRAFATAHLPVHGVRNVTAITTIQNQLRLLVAAADGYLYIYNLDSNEGGDLTLTKQHRLDGRIEDSTTKAPTDTTASPSTTRSEPKPVKNPDADSEKFREMAAAAESPPKGGFKFDDDQEFPPVTHKSD